VDRSLRRRGQVLVVVGASLGALVGAVLGLAVKDGPTSTAVAVAAPAGGTVLAATPASSQPGAPRSRAAGSGEQTGGAEPAGGQHTQSADRPDSTHGHAAKDAKEARKADEKGPDQRGDGRSGEGKDKAGKGKDKVADR